MKVGTEQEWQAARKGLLAAERELDERAQRVEEQRRELPWVPVEMEYAFATEEGPKTLPELFEGCWRLLIYHFMFGEDWETACPGWSGFAMHDGTAYNTYRVYPHSRSVRPLFSVLLELLPTN